MDEKKVRRQADAELLDQGYAAAKRGDYKTALALYLEAFELWQDDATFARISAMRIYLGHQAHNRGDFLQHGQEIM